jgi:hypothetical protein
VSPEQSIKIDATLQAIAKACEKASPTGMGKDLFVGIVVGKVTLI